MIDGLTFLFAAAQAAFDGFGNGDRLRYGERDGGVDGDAAVGRFLERFDPRRRHRYFDLDVRRQSVKMDSLFDERLRVAVEGRAGLHREPPFAAFFALEDRQEHGRAFQPDRFDQMPGDFVFRFARVGGDDVKQRLFPVGKFFFEYVEYDAGVGRCADCAVANGVHQFFTRAGVVPVIGRRGADGAVQRARGVVFLRFCGSVHRLAFQEELRAGEQASGMRFHDRWRPMRRVRTEMSIRQ